MPIFVCGYALFLQAWSHLIPDCTYHELLFTLFIKTYLLYPDLHCQINGSGILYLNCQYQLGMVFGSSNLIIIIRCMQCTNRGIILITVVVVIAGPCLTLSPQPHSR